MQLSDVVKKDGHCGSALPNTTTAQVFAGTKWGSSQDKEKEARTDRRRRAHEPPTTTTTTTSRRASDSLIRTSRALSRIYRCQTSLHRRSTRRRFLRYSWLAKRCASALPRPINVDNTALPYEPPPAPVVSRESHTRKQNKQLAVFLASLSCTLSCVCFWCTIFLE